MIYYNIIVCILVIYFRSSLYDDIIKWFIDKHK